MKNTFRSIKHFQKYFAAHQYMPKVFYDPCKTPPPPPTYLMYRSLNTSLNDHHAQYIHSESLNLNDFSKLSFLN